MLLLVVAGLLGYLVWQMGGAGQPRRSLAAEGERATTTATTRADDALGVMTVNIRIDDAKDAENAWAKRRELLVKTVLARSPDVVGCQEVSPAQGAYLIKEMKGYGHYPRGKAEGNENLTEFAAQIEGTLSGLDTVFFRSDRLELIEGRNGLVMPEQLQENPTENTFYALLVLKDREKKWPTLLVVNTHLRHNAKFAAQCAAKLRLNIGAVLVKYPEAEVVLTGDINFDKMGIDGVYRTLLGSSGGHTNKVTMDDVPLLKDTFDYSQMNKTELWGTYHAFTGKAKGTYPSDLIFTRGVMKASAAEIVRDGGAEGKWPSDHFFVLTRLTSVEK